MSDFDVNWPHGHETFDGLPARFITLINNGSKAVFIVTQRDGTETVYTQFNITMLTPPFIRNKPAPKRSGTFWVNVYPDHTTSTGLDTEYLANNFATHDRIACVKVSWTEGEGL